MRTTTFSSKQDTFSLAFSLQAPHLWKVKCAFLYLDQIYQKSTMGEDYTNMLLKKGEKNFRKGSPWMIREITFGHLATCGSYQIKNKGSWVC